MNNRPTTILATLCILAAVIAPALGNAPAEAVAGATGLADPGSLTKLTFEGVEGDKPLTFIGQDTRRQLVVTAHYDSGQARDMTNKVTYKVEPAGVVHVDPSGMVVPVGDGRATITADGPNGLSVAVVMTVERFNDTPPVNFPNQVIPIFTKLSCNSGGCHGKSGGQAGFRLSLLGFEPRDDYEYLVKENRGRRLFPAAPDHSLLLAKATNTIPHGGGERLSIDAHDYRVIRRWIAQGMPYGSDADPTVARIEVLPALRLMPRDGSQQLLVIAHYTDGSTLDVTHTAQYESNSKEHAEVSEHGLVKVSGLPGNAGIMVRYQGSVSVFRAMIPLGAPVDNLPAPRNLIDENVFNKLKLLGLPLSEPVDDATFIRRVSVDITGKLPSVEDVRQFVADADEAKRDKLIDRLLDSPAYADYFANKWSAVLRNKRRNDNFKRGTYNFHAWVRQSLHENKPYDQFVREILTASGELTQNPPVTWYREVEKTNEQLEDTAQLFLGVRIQCAQCHHHPFERWSQNDYYSFAAFFSQVGRKGGEEFEETRIFHRRGNAQARNPRTGQTLKPAGLGNQPLDLRPEQDPRHALADWMSDKDNPFFAHSLVNRYWKHFFSRGLVEPEDDMRATNPPTNPELLEALADQFVAGGYDLKALVREICRSKTYQTSAVPNQYNQDDTQNFSRYYPKRLNAEVLLDAVDLVTASKTKFNGLPQTIAAVQIPDTGGINSYFLTVFGKPEGSSACECERTSEANLAQSLHLINSNDIYNKLASGGGRARQLAGDKDRSDEQKLDELYMTAFSRPPTQQEIDVAKAHLAKAADDKKHEAWEDIVWAVLNTKEFLFNH